MERFGLKTKNKIYGNPPCRYCNAPNGTPLHKCPAIEVDCNKCGKKDTTQKHAGQKFNNNRTVERLTEEETTERNESSDESNESIRHIKEIKKIEEKNKHYTAPIKINGVRKEFITDTGSPITIMLIDKRVVKPTEILKVTNRYQYVNKNELNFREKIPVNVEYENNKQEMEILITERTNITPLLVMDWMKIFKFTIGKIQSLEGKFQKKIQTAFDRTKNTVKTHTGK